MGNDAETDDKRVQELIDAAEALHKAESSMLAILMAELDSQPIPKATKEAGWRGIIDAGNRWDTLKKKFQPPTRG